MLRLRFAIAALLALWLTLAAAFAFDAALLGRTERTLDILRIGTAAGFTDADGCWRES